MDYDEHIAGTLLGLAAGDALGAGYELQPPPAGDIGMIGGGLGDFAPGQWTDDTAMAVGVCLGLTEGGAEVDLAAIGEQFLEWAYADPAGIGITTAEVLAEADEGADLTDAAATYFREHPDGAAGNGALMRTAPVALAFLGDDERIAAIAREVASLTHADPLAGDSCVLWCIGIDRAIRERRLDGVVDGIDLLPATRRDRWVGHLRDAVIEPMSSFTPNGFTVTALQAAYAAVHQTPVPESKPGDHLRDALVAAVRIGDDTDTVAAIAGALLGARWGASDIPEPWRQMLHGWPGLRADDLSTLALRTKRL